jgi:hypothetical protein
VRTVLAFSALHIAQDHPDQTKLVAYTKKAYGHHQEASKLAIEVMSRIHETKSIGLFVFSLMTIHFGEYCFVAVPIRLPASWQSLKWQYYSCQTRRHVSLWLLRTYPPLRVCDLQNGQKT